jgi:hypothetical protein
MLSRARFRSNQRADRASRGVRALNQCSEGFVEREASAVDVSSNNRSHQ